MDKMIQLRSNGAMKSVLRQEGKSMLGRKKINNYTTSV